ncbi:MAG: oligoendopeptidase F [Mollicutes bacterium]|nr:oligoendopeptidase F [Mollicutes bacterium]
MAKQNWDLTYFFKSQEEFDAALENFKKYKDELASYKGKLSNEEDLKAFLRLEKKSNLDFVRLYFYAEMASDLDKTNVKNASNLAKVQLAMNDLAAATSFESPELLSLGREKLEKFVKENKEFEEYSFSFRKLFDQSEYVLSKEKEELLSSFNAIRGIGGTLYSQLTVADRKNSTAKLKNGEEVEVTMSNWSSLIEKSACEEDRQAIFEALYKFYFEHKNTYGEIYNLVLQDQLADVKSRGYKSILASHLTNSRIPEDVFMNLVNVVSSNTAPLKKYYELRRKALGLTKHRSYDRFLQLATSDKKYTYEEGKELFFKSIEHFPADFQEKAHEVLKDGFVDVNPKLGKRSGAYSNGGYDFHPFILLNWNGDLGDCFTLAHESGHSIHTLYSEEAQPTLKQDYTIFVAEIASTFNEHNLLDYLLKDPSLSKEDKIYLLQKSIDEIASTFYRQTLFGQFEYEIASLVEKGEPINYEVLCAKMEELYSLYYGIDIKEEKYKNLVWAYIPHLFYTPFYVYQYATSFTSSMLIYQRVKNNEPNAFDNYINLLKSGGSEYPVEQVKEANVDLTKKEPYLAVVDRMNELVDKLEELLK